MKSTLMLLGLILIAGCSSKAAYDNIQLNKRTACLKVPPTEYEQCMEDVDKPYEEYERERQEVIKG